MLAMIIHTLFQVYTLLLFGWVISSWFPALRQNKIVVFISFYIEPFLQIFRKLIPPIGGMIDLSPLLAMISLQIVEKILLRIFS